MHGLIIWGVLALVPPAGAKADAPAEWKLPEAEGRRWVHRIGEAVGRANWSVDLRGNEITVARAEPVAMARSIPNGPINVKSKPTPDGERAIRFVLRFAPKVSLDDYDRLAAINAASENEDGRLRREVRLPHKFDDFVATTPAEQERLRAFRAAVAKLPRHTLPDLYTPEHSLYFLHPWDGWSSPADEGVAAECREVEDGLMRLLGMYSPAAAARGRGVGRYLSEPRR